MIQFEKIKTSQDKDLAYKNRGEKPQATDFLAGDNLILVEKVDGYNISFNKEGAVGSRKTVITDDWTHHKPIIGIQDFVRNDEFLKAVANAPGLDPSHTYQHFGEYMVENRLIPYKDDVYNSIHLFDIYDETEKRYLGVDKAIALSEYLKANVDSKLADRILIPNVLGTTQFTSYGELEHEVYENKNKSIYSSNGMVEGAVVTNLSRTFQDNPLRLKIVNQEYKEVQRELQKPAKTASLRWLNQYLTEARVEKKLLDLREDGFLKPQSVDYFTDQLDIAKQMIKMDILNESSDTPTFSDKDKVDVDNKIEGFTRLVMIDFRNYRDRGDTMPDLSEALNDLMTDSGLAQ